ncbi:MAG: glutaredoxin family protein [Anaerolineae bacterium]
MHHNLTLYSKPGCHLCEIAEQLLLGLHREFDFSVEKVDISADPALVAEYGTRIPVIVIDGRTTLEAPIRSQVLRAALNGANP